MDGDPPDSNVVSFPGAEPKQDVALDFGDFVKAEIAKFHKAAGEPPTAMVMVLLDKGGNTSMDAHFVVGEEAGLARLYLAYGAACLTQSAIDPDK